jgi:hypothetical protein
MRMSTDATDVVTTVDPTTGLPALPEGFYFHVKYHDDGMSYPYIYVSIRKKHWIFWHTVVGSSIPIIKWDGNVKTKLDPAAISSVILMTADDLIVKRDKVYQDQDYWTSIELAAMRYDGNYPPKKLGGTD